MPVVWKYALHATVEMPEEAEVLSVGLDGYSVPSVWVRCDKSRVMQKRHFIVTVTGAECPPSYAAHHLGTFVTNEGLVYHVWEGAWEI